MSGASDATVNPAGARAAAGPHPRLSVVVVSWNGGEELSACLASAAGADREIVVVDNASTDDSPERVARDFPAARLLVNRSNLGFARAANRGLAAARGRLVLFLNPDARANDAAIEAASALLDRDPAVGLVAVANRDATGALVPTVEPFFGLRSLLSARAAERAQAPQGAGPVAVDWCHGAFLLGRRAELTALGGFDERFFLYAEDMDLCRRLQESGKSVVYLPQVSIVHRGNASGARLLGERRAAAIFASQLLYYERHHGRLSELFLRALATVFFGLRAAFYRLAGSPLAERYGALARVAFAGPAAGPLAELPGDASPAGPFAPHGGEPAALRRSGGSGR